MIVTAPLLTAPRLKAARPHWFALLVLALAMGVCGCRFTVNTASKGGSSTSTTLLGVRIKATRSGARSVSSSSTGDNTKGTLTTTIDGRSQTVTLEVSDPNAPDSPRNVMIDGKRYGTVKPGDEVQLTGDSVTINGKPAIPVQMAEAE